MHYYDEEIKPRGSPIDQNASYLKYDIVDFSIYVWFERLQTGSKLTMKLWLINK